MSEINCLVVTIAYIVDIHGAKWGEVDHTRHRTSHVPVHRRGLEVANHCKPPKKHQQCEHSPQPHQQNYNQHVAIPSA